MIKLIYIILNKSVDFNYGRVNILIVAQKELHNKSNKRNTI